MPPVHRGVSAFLAAGLLIGGVAASGWGKGGKPKEPEQIIVIGGPPKVLPTWPEPEAPVYYYVRTDGSNSNNGLTNSAGGAFLTIDYALDNADAGDIIRVQAGTYEERLSPAVSGTDGNPITLVADGAVTFCGISITNDHYIRVIGFTMDSEVGTCTNARVVFVDGTSNGWEFWNNTLLGGSSGISDNGSDDRGSNWVVVGNTFSSIASGGKTIGIRGNHNLFAYNQVDLANPDAFVIDGTYSYWLNNYILDASDAAAHSDVWQANSSSLGLQFNTIEGNRLIGSGDLSDEHGALIQNQGNGSGSCSTGVCAAITENMWRFNVWHNGSGSSISGDSAAEGAMTHFRQVHDSTVLMGLQAGSQTYVTNYRSNSTAHIHNNLNYQAWGPSATTNLVVHFTDTGASIVSADYNLAYDPDGSVTFNAVWTNQANELSNVDPALTNVGSYDFTIGSGSGARNAGGPLTTTSGSGTGTTFNVASGGGGFFRGPNTNITTYGGNLTAGDVITVGTDVVTVVSVSTDAITVTPSFTWADSEPVYLGADTTPDIGAFPYNAGGYTLTATHALSGATRTITPSDASLVRFVVCYSDGVPYAVDNASPYTCGNAYQFTARVYPRYAVATRYVEATP
jgi:hypothetical protein